MPFLLQVLACVVSTVPVLKWHTNVVEIFFLQGNKTSQMDGDTAYCFQSYLYSVVGKLCTSFTGQRSRHHHGQNTIRDTQKLSSPNPPLTHSLYFLYTIPMLSLCLSLCIHECMWLLTLPWSSRDFSLGSCQEICQKNTSMSFREAHQGCILALSCQSLPLAV